MFAVVADNVMLCFPIDPTFGVGKLKKISCKTMQALAIERNIPPTTEQTHPTKNTTRNSNIFTHITAILMSSVGEIC